MKGRRYPLGLFLAGLIINILVRYFFFFTLGVVLLIVGIFVDWCLYAGLVLVLAVITVSFIEQMKMRKTMLSDSDNESFRRFQDTVSKEGNVFENIRNEVEGIIEEHVDDDET